MTLAQIAKGVESIRLKPKDLYAGQYMRNSFDGECPRCGKRGGVTAYLTPISREIFQYGMECVKCFHMWNVQYGSDDVALKYVFG